MVKLFFVNWICSFRVSKLGDFKLIFPQQNKLNQFKKNHFIIFRFFKQAHNWNLRSPLTIYKKILFRGTFPWFRQQKNFISFVSFVFLIKFSKLDKQNKSIVFLGTLLVSLFRSIKEKKSTLEIFSEYKKHFKEYLNFKWVFSQRYSDSFYTSTEIVGFFDSFVQNKWFDPLKYDHSKMRVQRDPIQGDFNWIFDKAILALASPISNIPHNPEKPAILGAI